MKLLIEVTKYTATTGDVVVAVVIDGKNLNIKDTVRELLTEQGDYKDTPAEQNKLFNSEDWNIALNNDQRRELMQHGCWVFETSHASDFYNDFTLVLWPESQAYMEEDWFTSETVLANNPSYGYQAYFIPTNRIKK